MPEQHTIIGTVAPYLKLLREHAIFGELPEQALKDLIIRSDLVVFAAGELMLRQGDPSDSALLITQGEVDVLVDASPGPVQLGQLSTGALIGEIGIFADLPRTANVRAWTAVEALKLGRDAVLQIGGNDPAFLRAVMRELGKRIADFNQAIGFYTTALARLEQQLDPQSLEDPAPLPELVGFAHALRRIAQRISPRLRGAKEDNTA
jgi:phosphoserine phosphatase RsbU/P